MIVWIQVLNCQNCNQCLKCQVSSTVFPIVKNEGEKLGWKMRIKNEGQKWGPKMRVKNEGQKWGSKMRVKMRVKNEGQKWGTKICLIKCLIGHKSLGSLCNVLKALIVSGAQWTDQQTKGQGHLLSCSGQLKIVIKKCHQKLSSGHVSSSLWWNVLMVECVKEQRCPYTWEMKMSLTNKLLNGVL